MEKNVGERIKELRQKAGLTQEDFALRSGLGLRFVRELEQGKETVRLDKVNQALAMFGMTVLFSFITLPVEVDASRRAVKWLEGSGIASGQQLDMAKDALHAAAYTYVVSALGSLATLVYYALMFLGGRRR